MESTYYSLAQAKISLSNSAEKEDVAKGFNDMIERIHNGELKGTLVITEEERKALLSV